MSPHWEWLRKCSSVISSWVKEQLQGLQKSPIKVLCRRTQWVTGQLGIRGCRRYTSQHVHYRAVIRRCRSWELLHIASRKSVLYCLHMTDIHPFVYVLLTLGILIGAQCRVWEVGINRSREWICSLWLFMMPVEWPGVGKEPRFWSFAVLSWVPWVQLPPCWQRRIYWLRCGAEGVLISCRN